MKEHQIDDILFHFILQDNFLAFHLLLESSRFRKFILCPMLFGSEPYFILKVTFFCEVEEQVILFTSIKSLKLKFKPGFRKSPFEFVIWKPILILRVQNRILFYFNTKLINVISLSMNHIIWRFIFNSIFQDSYSLLVQ